MRNSRNNFTLIELLITVAIIAILAGMLLPALNRARIKAQTISCVNTAKGISNAVMLYCDSFDGFIPLASGNDFPGKTSGASWAWLLLSTGSLRSGSELICPGVKSYDAYMYKYTKELTYELVKNNTETTSWRAEYGGYGFAPFVRYTYYSRTRIGGFRSASGKVMLADAKLLPSPSASKPSAGYKLNYEMNSSHEGQFWGDWHGKIANTAFFDGHIEGIRGYGNEPVTFASSIYSQSRFKWKWASAEKLYEIAATSAWLLK